MFILPSFEKSLIVKQFQGNYLKVSFDAVTREKSIGYNSAHVCFN